MGIEDESVCRGVYKVGCWCGGNGDKRTGGGGMSMCMGGGGYLVVKYVWSRV